LNCGIPSRRFGDAMACSGVVVVEKRTFFELDCRNTNSIELWSRQRAHSDGVLDGLLNRMLQVGEDVHSVACADSPCCSKYAIDLSDTETGSTIDSRSSWASESEDETFEDPVMAKHGVSGMHVFSKRQTRAAQRMQRERGPWSCTAVVPGEKHRTTLILKQLPDGCSQETLCQLLTSLGFAGLYNFLYAPVNFRTGSLFGYCFINFLQHEAAVSALQALLEHTPQHFDGAQIEVKWSEPHQGLDVQIERYRNSPVMHPMVPLMYKPILLHAGERVDFPAPTRSIAPPKDWARQSNKRKQ